MKSNHVGNKSIARMAAGVLLALLAGCSSIPTMVPDMALQPSRPVQLEGAQGPLTAQQSKALLAKLEKNGDDTNIFDKHLAL